ncbi:GNAT family N-acetyltransferase [Yinghuangia soli]|uniref:N-acetyltransferase n=1 Tax=Yinghuangia soli TaxID=2908204 RepID=A0AA41Q6K0_9ACTN|nr:N-acetyltransferase [Yinghuangia soli]MCF2532510.1 N-acetyltransferase [Yinghuangia soli]
MNTRIAWTVRPKTDADRAAVHAVNAAAFETPAEAELVDALRTDEGWIPGLSYVATTPDGTVAGYVLLTRCHIGETPALCLAPVAVLPEYQKSGAGAAVIDAVLARAREMGESAITVLGHPDYYPRFGFQRASSFGIHAPVEVPDEAMMAMSLDGAPLPSGTIRYAAAFGI